jgi:hypothetical protein
MTIVTGGEVDTEAAPALWELTFPAMVEASKRQN